MSDRSEYGGWRQASDGTWFPPRSDPDSLAESDEARPTASRSTDAGRTPSEWVAIAGAGAVAIGSFLPWASIGEYSVNGTDNGDGLWTLAAGCIAGALVIVRRPAGALAAFVISTLLGAYELLNVSAVESDASWWDVTPGVGLFAIIAGGVAGALGVSIARWGPGRLRGDG